MEHLSEHRPEGSDAAPQQCHAPEPAPIVLLIAYIAHCGQVMASVRAIFEGQFQIEATIRSDEALLTSLCSAE